MRLGLTKPGMPAAYRSPFLGFEDLHFTSDDVDDPRFTGGGGGGSSRGTRQTKDDDSGDDDGDDEDEDDEEDDEDEEDTKSKKRPAKKAASSKKATDDEDEDDEDDEEDRRPRAVRQAARYRTQLRAEQKKTADLEARLQAIEDKDKKPDELASRDLVTTRERADKAEGEVRTLTAQLAFFRVGGIDWVDASDAFALAEREGLFDDVIDESGTVDQRELRRGLRDLAKRKKYLVKSTEDPKARGRKSTDADDEDEEEDEEPRSRRSASTMNGGTKRKRSAGPSRESLAKKFPALNRM